MAVYDPYRITASGKAAQDDPSTEEWADKNIRHLDIYARAKEYGGQSPTTVEQQRSDQAAAVERQRTNQAALDAEMARQQKQQQDYLTRFRGAIAGQETLPAIRTRVESSLGVPTLRTALASLQDVVQNLPQTATARAAAGGGSEQQRRELLAAGIEKYQPQLSDVTRRFQTAESQAANLISATQAQQQKELQPIITEGSMLSDQLAREMTGYTQNQQSELNMLLEQYRRENTLSDQQWQRVNELADQEAKYQQQLKLEQMKAESAQTVEQLKARSAEEVQRLRGEALKSVGRYGLYDPTTGEIVGGGSSGGGTNLSQPPGSNPNDPYGLFG